MSQKIYEMITDRILDLMNQGKIPWSKPWNSQDEAPQNLTSKRHYRGINAFLLSCLGGSPYWLTFKQAKELGGTVKKGSKGVPVVFWNWTEKEVKDETTGQIKKETIPFLKYYTVFNAQDIEGIESKIPQVDATPKTFDPIKEAQAIIDGMPQCPVIEHGGNRAFYRPSEDRVQLPNMGDFINPEAYYSVAFHELGHSTGHASRLARKDHKEVSFFGDHNYSREELVAEMTAAFLCGSCGIEKTTIENSAAYIQGWAKTFKDNVKMVVCAAAQAQKAADFILNVQTKTEE